MNFVYICIRLYFDTNYLWKGYGIFFHVLYRISDTSVTDFERGVSRVACTQLIRITEISHRPNVSAPWAVPYAWTVLCHPLVCTHPLELYVL